MILIESPPQYNDHCNNPFTSSSRFACVDGTFVCPCFMTLCLSYLLKELITIGCMWNWSSEFLKEELLFANFGESHHTDNLFIVDSPLTSDSLSVVSRGSKARHPVITIWRPMREFGRVTVTTKLGEQS